MLIFIDESGVFANPMKQQSAVSCIAGVVLPESAEASLHAKFRKLLSEIGCRGELKGSRLSEAVTARVLQFIDDLGGIAEITAIDLGLQISPPQQVTDHQRQQAQNFVAGITKKTHLNMARELRSLQQRVLDLPQNLYAQSFVLTDVVNNVIRSATMHFAQCSPSELSKLHWRIDAKNDNVTEYEKLWLEIVLPFIQYLSLKDPFVHLEDKDYSHFERFYLPLTEPPEHLKKHLAQRSEPFRAISVRPLIHESCSFMDSSKDPGLQLADVVATTFRRCLRGTLKEPGWRGLGMLLRKRHGRPIKMLTLRTDNTRVKISSPYVAALQKLNRSARSIIV